MIIKRELSKGDIVKLGNVNCVVNNIMSQDFNEEEGSVKIKFGDQNGEVVEFDSTNMDAEVLYICESVEVLTLRLSDELVNTIATGVLPAKQLVEYILTVVPKAMTTKDDIESTSLCDIKINDKYLTKVVLDSADNKVILFN